MFERSSYEKDIKKHDRIFSNTGSDAVSLCLCEKQLTGTETDEPNISTDRETLPGKPDEKLPEKPHSETGESDEQSK